MGTVRLRLRLEKANQAGEAPLYLVYQHLRKRAYFATGYALLPAHWDESRGKVRRSHPHSTELNGYLDRLTQSLLNLELQARANGEPVSTESIRAAFLELERPSPKSPQGTDSVTLLEAVNRFLGQHAAHRRSATLKTYKTLTRHLEHFTRKKPTPLADVDTRFATEFTAYLAEKGLTTTSTAKVVAILKRVLRWADLEAGLHVAPNYARIRATRPRTPVGAIALTRQDIEALEALEIANRAIADTRDVFLFGCYTGLRFSDIERLRPEDIEGDILRLVLVKTAQPLRLRMLPQAVAILQRHRGRYPTAALPVVSNQAFNRNLKALGQLAGFAQPVVRVKFVGAKRIEEALPRWALLTTHTARRTFATISLSLGVAPTTVQRALGHADVRQTLQYVKATEIEMDTELVTAWQHPQTSA